MFYRIKSATLIGVDASVVEIEVDLKRGLPQQTIVGLPDAAVKEAKERVNSAIRNAGFEFPLGKLTVNLAPADVRKEGSTFDLGIALGTLTVSGQIHVRRNIDDFLVLGELSLDGHLRPVHGVLAILEAAIRHGIGNVLLPAVNRGEAGVVSRVETYPVACLEEAVGVLTGGISRADLEGNRRSERQGLRPGEGLSGPPDSSELPSRQGRSDAVGTGPSQAEARRAADFSEIRGQNYAVRAAEIAAAGGHNLLLIGSPGSGKTMIASRIPSILPDLDEREAFETTKIYSIAGMLEGRGSLMTERPFRAPHHTASEVSIVGGGKNPIPGEITLSHNGILFLDEFSEFRGNIIQSLRQPLESGRITIARADSRITYPALFMLVASMNPCPCGYLFDRDKECKCTPSQLARYYTKLSGPILDRIDVQVEVKPLPAESIVERGRGEPSETIRGRVVEARERQRRRLRASGVPLNSRMSDDTVKKCCVLSDRMERVMMESVRRYRLSARSYLKTLRVARTIADLAGRDSLEENDLLEALSYRDVERALYARSAGRA